MFMVDFFTASAFSVFSSFLLSFIIAIMAIPAVIHVAERKNLVDKPDGIRKKHRYAVPTLGGIAIFSSFLISYSLFGAMPDTQLFPYLIAGLAVLFFAGLKDDILVLSPVKKLFSQVFAASIVVILGGVYIPGLDGLFGIYGLPMWLSIPFSIFSLIIILNAYNLIDGVDGLAGSVGLLISVVFGVWFLQHGFYAESVLAFTLAGSLLGFLAHNIDPARIFMGDTGSMTVGLLIGVMAFKFMTANEALPASEAVANPAIVAFAILMIPMFDTLRVILLRIKRRQSPLEADNNHIHHRLMRLGFRHRGVTVTLILANLIIISAAFLLDGINANLHMLALLALPAFILPAMTMRYMVMLRRTSRADISFRSADEEPESSRKEVLPK